MKKATLAKKQRLPNAIKGAIDALREHWVYDTVQLFNDSAVALHRIAQLLERLERAPNWLDGNELEIMQEISDFALFIREWESLSKECLNQSLVCPDEVEARLESLLKVINMPLREKRAVRRRWSTEDNLSSFEPPVVATARCFWD